MIRYVYIGDQINDGAHEFAFFDTVRDLFVSIGGDYVFGSLRDLREAAKFHEMDADDLARLIRLIPDRENRERAETIREREVHDPQCRDHWCYGCEMEPDDPACTRTTRGDE